MTYRVTVDVQDITEFGFSFAKFMKSDINEHIPIMHKYANECNHITEFGVRHGVSTWAWLASNAKIIRCFDIVNVEENLKLHYGSAKDTKKDFTFTCVNTIAEKLEIEKTDLLFIDTAHTYEQCYQELKMHGDKVNKYIIFHDTTLCLELNKAIEEFLNNNLNWKIKEVYKNNNGLTILERIS